MKSFRYKHCRFSLHNVSGRLNRFRPQILGWDGDGDGDRNIYTGMWMEMKNILWERDGDGKI